MIRFPSTLRKAAPRGRQMRMKPFSVFFVVFVGTLALSSCSDREKADVRFFRPPIALPSDQADARKPALSSDRKGAAFFPLEKVEEEGSGRILFHGHVDSFPFPVEAVWTTDAGEKEGQIGGGFHIEVDIIQVSEWQRPPVEVLAEGKEVDFQQSYSRHLFFDPEGGELSPEQAVARFPRVGGGALFPTSRNGTWYQDSFKRQVALWFRIRDGDGIPMKSGDIRALGAFDQQTGFPISWTHFFGMGNAEYRMLVNTPFWHDGGLDFVLDRFHTAESSHQEFDLIEGEVYEMEGFHVQVLLFRPGVWESRSLTEGETDLVQSSSFARAVERVSEEGSTLMAVTDGGPTGSDWMMEVIGVDGKTMWPVRRNGPFLHQVFGTTPRQRDRVEPSRLRITRGPDRDRVIVSVNGIAGTSPENAKPANLFDQRVPFFYAKNLREALEAVSQMVAIEWGPPFPSIPRKPEGFPLVLQDVTVREIAEEIAKRLETEGFGFELNQESWRWTFPSGASLPVSGLSSEPGKP